MGTKVLVLTVTLLSTAIGFAGPRFAKPAEAVYQANELALKLTKKLRTPPPQMAFMLSLANHAAVQATKNSVKPDLSYYVAFTEFYSLAYPDLREYLQSDLNYEGFDAILAQKAQMKARSVWKSVEGLYKAAATPASPPWPSEGYEMGGWKPTPPNYAQPLYPNWNKLPLHSGLNNKELLSVVKPLAFNSHPYMKEAMEVRDIGGRVSAKRNLYDTTTAYFWAAGAGTVTPPGMWVQIAIKNLRQTNVSFSNAAQVMMVLSKALSDAGVVAWSAKYSFATCRPITAVEQLLGDKNWAPLLDTPPFPSWVSGHSTFSSAAAVVVDTLILRGQKNLEVESEAVPSVVRTYKDAWEAAEEAGVSRIYGGIHFQDDNVDGLELGKSIGCAMVESVGFYCE